MKFFLDLLPVIVFFTVYKYSDIFLATLWAIVISIFIAAVTFVIKKTIEKMVIVNTLLITFLGGLTILFQDNTFIMWKPTAIYWLIAFTLFGSQIFLRKNLIKKMMSKQFQLSEKRWSFLNTNVIIFMILIGFLNLYVAFNFDENTWVNFKLFGITSLLILFMIYLAIFVSKEPK